MEKNDKKEDGKWVELPTDDLPICRLSPTANPNLFLDRDTGELWVVEQITFSSTGTDLGKHYLVKLNEATMQ